jgi:hypothetical protein
LKALSTIPSSTHRDKKIVWELQDWTRTNSQSWTQNEINLHKLKMKAINANWNQNGHKWSHKRHTFTWFTMTQTWEESSFSSQYYSLWLVIKINKNGKNIKTLKNELQKFPIFPIYESFKPCPKDLVHLYIHVWSPLIKSHGIESQAFNFVFPYNFMFLLQLQNKGCNTLSHWKERLTSSLTSSNPQGRNPYKFHHSWLAILFTCCDDY